MGVGVELLKPVEVAELLRVKPDTIRRWAKSGRLPGAVFVGGASVPMLRFRRDAIEGLLQSESSDG